VVGARDMAQMVVVAGRGPGPRRLGAVEDVAGNLADGIGRRQRRD